MVDLKELLFQKTFEAEQNRLSCRVGSREEKSWNVAYETLMNLISDANLNNEYYRWRRDAKQSGCFGCLMIVACAVIVALVMLIMRII